ncbi:hypothetical protein FKM82_007591 [Ascaphus truei]
MQTYSLIPSAHGARIAEHNSEATDSFLLCLVPKLQFFPPILLACLPFFSFLLCSFPVTLSPHYSHPLLIPSWLSSLPVNITALVSFHRCPRVPTDTMLPPLGTMEHNRIKAGAFNSLVLTH